MPRLPRRPFTATFAALSPIIAFVSSPSPAASAQITRVADAVTGISADGTAVSGFSVINEEIQIIRWTTTLGAQPLGPGAAFDISRDGSVLVGERFNGTTSRSVRWSAGTGVVDLGQLPGAAAQGTVFSQAYDVSADGSIVVGFADTNATAGPPYRGYRWTADTDMVALFDLPGGNVFSQASAISADGQTIVGYSDGANGTRAVRWIGANSAALDMGMPIGRTGFTEATHVSSDGSVVVGVWGNGFENEAFRWTASGGYQMLGDLPGGILDSVATATNADGSVIVGTGNPGDELPDEPFYWTSATGLRPFRDVLTDNNIDFSQWQRFVELRDLSDDGTIIVGNGILNDGSPAGFRVVLPTPSAATAMGWALAMTMRRQRRMG